MRRIPITQWAQMNISNLVKEPDLCIDATCGTGKDTLFLCRLGQKEGRVLAFDIQEEAIRQTKTLLEEHGYLEKVKLIQDSHANMEQYAARESVDLIMFNLGYLPGGDHSLATDPAVTIQAIEQGLTLLRQGGLMSILIYSGGDSGFVEKEALLNYLKELNAKEYTVIVDSFYNKPNNPPIPVYIIK